MIDCPGCGEANPARFRLCGYCGTALATVLPVQESRKTVTILFSDLKGSTALGETLDSEALREVMTAYFDAMSVEIVRHGGTIEKFIGDAIMAVFGLPTVHEDDALRAVRAAAGMRRALVHLNAELERTRGVRLTNRTGVNTGEVVAGDPTTGQRLVTGDAVNTAARLEQAAPADEVLLGALTWTLVRDAVVVEPVEPLELKGKAERVAAYRLIDLRGDEGVARRHSGSLVGRVEELAALDDAWRHARQDGCTRLVTVIGDAGLGKSRLVREFVDRVGDEADVLHGRCLSYGEGITFWPMVEITGAAADISADDSPEQARAKLLALVGDDDVVDRVAAAIGLSAAPYPLSELYWGVRRLVELMAERRPIVLVVDDIHWAESAFLDLVEHLLEGSSGAPVLLLCTARPDLLEQRPAWGERNASTRLWLRRLGDAESGQIVENLLGDALFPADVRGRIVAAAEGNPLFVEQMLSMLLDTGALRLDDGRWIRADEASEIVVPPSIQALIAARLDRLSREERAVVEPASVIGLVVPGGAIATLTPDPVRPQLQTHLADLDRKQLLHPESTESADAEPTWRFHHLLIRDAAYGTILKRTRAQLHERFVAWADSVNAERGREQEFEEILGYHLEQAYRYRSELGPLDEEGVQLGVRAAERLTGPGRRALLRGDMPAAAGLLRRAAALYPVDDPRGLVLLPSLADALWEMGALDEAEQVLEATAVAAERIAEPVIAANAAIVRLYVDNLRGGGEGWALRCLAAADRYKPIFEDAGDHLGLSRMYRLLTWVHGTRAAYGDAVRAAEQGMVHARSLDDQREELGVISAYAMGALYGPTPVAEATARVEVLVVDAAADRGTEALLRFILGQLKSMQGDFASAREHTGAARALLDELGRKVFAASFSGDSWRVEVLAGDASAALEDLRRDYELLETMGEKYYLSSVAGVYARVLELTGDYEEADRLCRIAQSLTTEDDLVSEVTWRAVRARLVARAGDAQAALEHLEAALARLRPTDAAVLLADTLMDQSWVLRHIGRDAEAGAAAEEARQRYADKGDVAALRLHGF